MMKKYNKTCDLLIKHCCDYPGLQLQDIFKFLYQSAFGCEHFVSSLEKATEIIKEEYNHMPHKYIQGIEPLDGSYSRVPLSYMRRGISAETLGRLFVLSARQEEPGLTILMEKLKAAKALVRDGYIPFTEEAFENAVNQWASEGYKSVHHSDAFREKYCPSYRVIANRYIPFLPLFAEIDKLLSEKKVIIAVDGGSASGKTTLSRMLEEIYQCTVFHMDDFFLRPEQRTPERYGQAGGNVDRERFLSEVLEPLSMGEDVLYRKFDCASMTLAEGERVIAERLVIVEGAYSMHPELEGWYDFSVFLDISPELQRERILHRNSNEKAKSFFERWIPLENAYFEQTDIRNRCKMIIAAEPC